MAVFKNLCNCSFDKELVAIRTSYFLMLGALGTLNPFMIVFMKVIRMSAIEISIIFGISTALSAPFRLVIGYYADKTEQRGCFYFVSSVLTAFLTYLIFYVPTNEQLSTLNISSHGNWSLCTNAMSHHVLNTDDAAISIQDDLFNRPDRISDTGIHCWNEDSQHSSLKIETSSLIAAGSTNNTTTNFTVVQLKGFIDTQSSHISSQHCLLFEHCNFTQLHSEVFSTTFISSFLLVCLSHFAFAPLQNILDSLIYRHLAKTKDITNFGRIRLFGTIGYGSLALVSGFIIDSLRELGYSERKTYFFCFLTYTISISLSGIILLVFVEASSKSKIKKDAGKNDAQLLRTDDSCGEAVKMESLGGTSEIHTKEDMLDEVGFEMVVLNEASGNTPDGKKNDHSNGVVTKDVNVVQSKDIHTDLNRDTSMTTDTIKALTDPTTTSWREFTRVASKFYMVVLIVSCLVAGTKAGCIEGFFFYFLDSLDPNNKLVMGLSLAFSSVGEIIVLFFSGKVMQQLGKQNCLYLVFVVYALRSLANSFITNVWFGILTDLSQSICFGLFYPIITEWASSLTPFKLQSTVQCYIGAVYFSLGRATGVGLGGLMYSALGPRLMFRIFACISFLYALCLVFLFKVVDGCRKK